MVEQSKLETKRPKSSRPIPKSASEDQSLDIYLREIREIPLLSREDEVDYARDARSGDRDALNKLVQANLRLRKSV